MGDIRTMKLAVDLTDQSSNGMGKNCALTSENLLGLGNFTKLSRASERARHLTAPYAGRTVRLPEGEKREWKRRATRSQTLARHISENGGEKTSLDLQLEVKFGDLLIAAKGRGATE